MSSALVLTRFNEKLALKLDTDTLHYGIGVVISHILPSGKEKPIAYASRTLSKSERNYAQIEKEALCTQHYFRSEEVSPIFVRKKISFSYRPQTVNHIEGPKSGIPTLAAARLQRWVLLLAAHQYDTEYRLNADCLSRLPIHSDKANEEVDEVRIINLLQIESFPMNVDRVRRAT